MISTLSEAQLLTGAVLALKHAIDLENDSATMWLQNRYSTAFQLAVMAREEVGRHNILLVARNALSRGESVTWESLSATLRDHKSKLSAGQFGVVVEDTESNRRLVASIVDSSSEEAAAAAFEELNRIAHEQRPKDAAKVHQRRLASQYVDFDPNSGSWISPASFSSSDAYTLVATVGTEIANALIATGALLSSLEIAVPEIGGLPTAMEFYEHSLSRLRGGDA